MTPEPLILAVETSSRTGSVAVAAGERLLAEMTFSGPMRHSAEIFPAISGLMERFAVRPRQIEQVHISIGPGSFTGLRIATTLAKTMYLANGARIVAVDTLDVIAANVFDLAPDCVVQNSTNRAPVTRDDRVAAILDAKRNQFFIAVYEHTGDERPPLLRAQAYPCGGRGTSDAIWEKAVPDSLMTAAQFVERFARSDRPTWLLGDGLLYYKDRFIAEGIRLLDERYWSPRASKVHLLGWQKALVGQFADPVTLQPNYLRRPDVRIKKINPPCRLAD